MMTKTHAKTTYSIKEAIYNYDGFIYQKVK